MKKIQFAMLSILTLGLTACSSSSTEEAINDGPTKAVKFTLKGDFAAATFKGTMSADGSDLTDLWVFDYLDGTLAQQLHQSPTDADWGQPTLNLAYGTHSIFFVASRGKEPSVDAAAGTIIWGTPSDTFWEPTQVTVSSTSAANRTVTLMRVATRLRLTVLDEVPANIASVTISPSRWYYGLNFTTGNPVASKAQERTIAVPASFAGTSGNLVLSIFGLSSSDEWAADVNVTATATDGTTLGAVTITGAPFKANRSTEYSGNLFAASGTTDINLATTWEAPRTATW